MRRAQLVILPKAAAFFRVAVNYSRLPVTFQEFYEIPYRRQMNIKYFSDVFPSSIAGQNYETIMIYFP